MTQANKRQGDEPLRAPSAGRPAQPTTAVAGIGNANFDLWAAGHRPQNFYMLGSMGLAIPIALGVAIAQPRRHVVALEGDGSLLMQLGCLATVAMRAPKNLTIVLWDNGIYQITGAQPTASAATADLAAIARGGLANAHGRRTKTLRAPVCIALKDGGPSLIAGDRFPTLCHHRSRSGAIASVMRGSREALMSA
jgi:thiamine pyrophosphate-dependent acetolactate synthase large subunit-like protein